MQQWLETPPGRYLQAWEQAAFDDAVADIFGYHALQLGLPDIDSLRANRMPHRWLGLQHGEDARGRRPHLVADSHALPFEAGSLDLVILPHSLELSADPHGTLREVERVLVPEGKVVISGLNPASLWGMRQARARMLQRIGVGQLYLPDAGEFIGYRRLRDWLRLLNFEVEIGSFGCWRPALSSEKWLARYEWMDRLGERWWPIFGAAYFLVAVKRVRGVRVMGQRWKRKTKIATAPVPVANRGHRIHQRKHKP
ncbi:methyltransferase domain-containing protein [Ramlibacter sp. AN1015]|uniref:class I SAM-dependent methyltransferase n=1 Tax=Ramlibacter sp. AN1015 TaxID=3133428 RepID=UPI0030C0E84D